MKTYGGVEVYLHNFDFGSRGEWSASRPKTSLGSVEKRNISCLCRESNPGRPARSPSLYSQSYPRSTFENNALWRLFGHKRDEVTREWRKLHNKEFQINNIIRTPVTVAEQSKVCTVFTRSEAGSWVRIPLTAWTFDVCACACVFLCLFTGTGLATSWSPVQGGLPTV
jgi:hypothetical protein